MGGWSEGGFDEMFTDYFRELGNRSFDGGD